jgi:cellulose synthase (UDP-forming)
MSSAALLLTGPFPALAMIWFFPQRIYPHNYLPMLPAIAATLFVFPLLSRGWRPTIYRVCMINSCCHLYAVWYTIRGSVAEWVPTGASSRKGQVPVMVNRILCTWIFLVQGLLWSGLVLRMHQYGWHAYWTTAVLAVVQLYMLAPLLTPSKGVWRHAQEQPAEVAT